MKKIEAKELAFQRSKLIIEYLEQILVDDECVEGNIIFSTSKINNEMMLTLDLYIPKSNFEKHLNLGITSQHSLVLYEQLLNDLLDNFLDHEMIGISKYYSIKSVAGPNFSGINVINDIGSSIKINFNFNTSNPDIQEIFLKYNQRIDDYVLAIQNDALIADVPRMC